MPKCDFNKIALRHGCSPVNLLHIFRTPFLKSTSGWLLLLSISCRTFTIVATTLGTKPRINIFLKSFVTAFRFYIFW